MILDERIIERSNRKLEGKLKSEINDIIDFNNPNDQKYNIESIIDFRNRIEDFLKEIDIKYKGKNVLIVTHRVFLRCLQCYWEKRRIEDIYQCKWLSNCSVSELIFKSGELLPVNIGKEDFLGDNITKVLSKI